MAAVGSQSRPSSLESTSDLIKKLDFSDGIGWLALGFAVLLAVISFAVWCVRTARKHKEEARLVTSHHRLLGGMNVPFQYEVSIHNATPHPLRTVEVRYWDGTAWRPVLAHSSQTGDPVVLPDGIGIALVPAMTTDRREFDRFYFFRYTDSRNRTWDRRIDSPDFLSRDEIRQLEQFHGTI